MDSVSAVDRIEEALDLRRPHRVNVFCFQHSFGQEVDLDSLAFFFTAIEPFVTSGEVEWFSLGEMYEEFLDWEARTWG